MSIEQILIGMLGLACGAIGWFAREIYNAVQKLKDDLRLLEVRIGTDYGVSGLLWAERVMKRFFERKYGIEPTDRAPLGDK